MKKRMNKFIYVLAALVLFATSCDWEPIMWDSSKTYIAFTTPGTVVPEEGDMIGIAVLVTALEGSPAVSVDFEFDTVGIDPAVAAIEGEQYELVNENQTLSFPDGWGYDTIWIRPIDNDIFTGDKVFNVTLTSNTVDYAFGAPITNVVTVKDNEHPLNLVLGNYIETDYYFTDGSVDGTYEVTITPDPDDLTKVNIFNFWGGGEVISASVDLDAMTISISTEEVIYISGTYGDATITLLDDAYEYTDGDLLVCPIEENGDWSTPKWAATVSAGWFGKFQTSTFVKQ
jgi:hypothetical protein